MVSGTGDFVGFFLPIKPKPVPFTTPASFLHLHAEGVVIGNGGNKGLVVGDLLWVGGGYGESVVGNGNEHVAEVVGELSRIIWLAFPVHRETNIIVL